MARQLHKCLPLMFCLTLCIVTACSDRLARGLVVHYPFNGNAHDAGPHALHGVAQGAALTTDRFEKEDAAYRFDGDDFIEVADDTVLRLTDNFTLVAWINMAEAKRMGSRILDKSVGSTNYGFLFDTYNKDMSGRTLRLFVGDGWKYMSQTPLALNTWHCVVGTFEQGVGRIYINGKLDMENTGNRKTIITSTTPLRIGFDTGVRRGNDFDDSFVGKIDDVRIYNRVLSDKEIAKLFAQR